eukprot:jgi/Phyca11/133656/e_gw1.623.2.1
MESATSTSTVVIIVLVDVIQSASVLYRLHRRTSTILEQLNQFLDPIEENKSFLTAVSRICRCGDKFQKQNRKKIQIRSCLHHNLATGTPLEILFTVECILLSAFLDAVVPHFYGIFMFVMVNFQSVKYHSELTGVTKETIGDVVDSIFVFSIVELAALCLVAVLVYRNLRINAMHHLAFVLETQTELIQTKWIAWVTMTLAFRVVHFGTYEVV